LRGLILLEGPNLFSAAASAGLRFETILATEDDFDTHQRAGRLGQRVTLVSDRVLSAAADADHPRSPVASAVAPEESVPRPANTVILVGLSDPGNAGTIIRTAAAFGWDVARTPNTVDLWGPKTLRAGAGAHFSTGIWSVPDIATLGDTHTVIATLPRPHVVSPPMPGPYALLVGNEAHGLDTEVVTEAHAVLSIPMAGDAESLNAAVAAGVAMYILDQ